MRLLLIALGAMALSACNLVYSERPLFAAADTRGAPPLRPGVWIKQSPDCVVEPAQDPLPSCAEPLAVGETELKPPPDMPRGKGGPPDRIPYLLAGGQPRIMQIGVETDPGKTMWLYQALRPLRLDETSRVVEARLWPVLCGPPPPKGATKNGEPSFITQSPLPGLEVRAESCLARAQGPVRHAAAASEAWDDDALTIRWLREGDH